MAAAEKKKFVLIILLILISKLPFLNCGYGAEEDAWAMRLVTERIATSRVYEVSRLPGHPVQEIIYSLMPKQAFVFNLLTLLISTGGIIFFMLALQRLKIENYLSAGIAIAFVPVIFINSANALDYMWAFAFSMASFYCLLGNNFLVCGILIGIAVGCRITSGAMLAPFIYYAYSISNPGKRLKNILLLLMSACACSALVFLPVMNQYGINFFQYYEHFPLPSFAKSFYKGSIAVWGTIGVISLIIPLFLMFPKVSYLLNKENTNYKHLIRTCCITIALYLIAFIKLPLKSAFMIPLIPFVILLIYLFFNQKQSMFFALAMIASCFLLGINLSDPVRAAPSSTLSLHASINHQSVSFDLLQGPVIADYLKRKKQMKYADEVINSVASFNHKTLIIAGWWLANILVQQKGKENSLIEWRYYLTEGELKNYIMKGYAVYYLPQQDEFNDLRYNSKFTNRYASLLKMSND